MSGIAADSLGARRLEAPAWDLRAGVAADAKHACLVVCGANLDPATLA